MKKAVLREYLKLRRSNVVFEPDKEAGSLDFKEVKPKRTRKPKGEK